jgi:two-component system NtrC family sensor kinase
MKEILGGVAVLLLLGLVWRTRHRRRIAERALALERRLLRAFLESTRDQVYFKDRESRFLRVSDTLAARVGFERAEDLLGKTDFDAFSEEHARQAFDDEQRIIRSGHPIVDLVERETFPDGREAWVSTTKMALRGEQGEVMGTFGVSRDVTARVRAEAALREGEERWRRLLANLQEIVLLVDPDGVLLYATPSVERWLGYPTDELLGTKLADASHPDDSAQLEEAFAAATPGRPASLGHRLRHLDGSWHSLESTFVCLRDDPAVGGVLVAARDVTERVALELERERLDSERRLAHRLEAVGQLAAGIAHEINTPLQFVGDSVAFLNEALDELLALVASYHGLVPADVAREIEERADLEYLRERVPTAFGRTVEGIERVRTIVLAMKSFSHPASAKAAPADLNDALETTLTVSRNEYKYVADVTVELGELPAVVCNIGELNQVFLNLVVNAAQAISEKVGSTDERGAIAVSTRVEGAYAVIEIADDGPGIPPELLDRIWEPFFTTKEVGKGSGQGLALARSIVERHGGSLQCTSAPGEGTRFTVRLPLTPVTADVAAAA